MTDSFVTLKQLKSVLRYTPIKRSCSRSCCSTAVVGKTAVWEWVDLDTESKPEEYYRAKLYKMLESARHYVALAGGATTSEAYNSRFTKPRHRDFTPTKDPMPQHLRRHVVVYDWDIRAPKAGGYRTPTKSRNDIGLEEAIKAGKETLKRAVSQSSSRCHSRTQSTVKKTRTILFNPEDSLLYNQCVSNLQDSLNVLDSFRGSIDSMTGKLAESAAMLKAELNSFSA
mmetsp:Transcript_9506/g.18391  ORF Transcript_9506/g.18391 Transcript_9506/m.18391 type:complete len:227 (-) Transcript_9506:984-1664(-)|eukprot:CAMPEP_0204901934 /NCGR_PEP_ID=MMETSP1397-20131031/3367_1 /ASSEMBLY_ACC=CAM_ASM_000891 /TAXON_ID=49980 /ORGANISM="Climacostomum Climacostomum virens, Strain Stock W-24" /LENGTH=226 /DNA_ID=CAMNT_0052070361 /DNA_START=714 /DNA_END=1394 /DNA_ORIENTATION=+